MSDDKIISQSPVERDLKLATKKERLDKLFEQAYGEDKIEMITELSQDEIRQISIAWSYAEDFGFAQLKSMIIEFLKLRVSLGRKGRKEYVDISSAEELKDLRMIKAQQQGGILSRK